MKLGGFLVAAVLALLLVGLLMWRRMGPEAASEVAADTRRVQVVVDDSVIAAGDPYAVIDPVWWTADIYGSADEYQASLRSFSRSQRLVHALCWNIAEVNNGGHDQFYFNSTGIVWPDAIAAFDAIGLSDGADIVRQSAQRLGGAPARDRSERQNQLEQKQPRFDDLDDQFYELQKRVDLDTQMMEFIRGRPSDFYFEGVVEKPPPIPSSVGAPR